MAVNGSGGDSKCNLKPSIVVLSFWQGVVEISTRAALLVGATITSHPARSLSLNYVV